jgi:hypothetical protein
VSPRTNSIRIGWWLLGDDAVSAAFQPPKPPAVTVRVDPKSVREVGGRTFHVPRNESLFTIASERLPDRRRLPVAGTEAAAVGDCFSLNRPARSCLRRSIKARVPPCAKSCPCDNRQHCYDVSLGRNVLGHDLNECTACEVPR